MNHPRRLRAMALMVIIVTASAAAGHEAASAIVAATATATATPDELGLIAGPATRKPPSPTPFPIMRIPGTAATVALHGRFHLVRTQDHTLLRSTAPVEARIDGLGAPVTIHIPAMDDPLVTLTTDGTTAAAPPVARVVIPQATITVPDTRVRIENLVVHAILSDEPTISVESLRLEPQGVAAWAPAIDLVATLTLANATLALSGAATAVGHPVAVDFDGSVDTDSRVGRIDFRLNPVVFTPQGLQPRSVVPMLAEAMDAVEGRMGATATLNLGEGEPEMTARVELIDISFSVGDARAQSLNGTIRLSSLLPPATPPGQTLRVARIDAGLPVTNALLQFQIDRLGRLRIETAGVDVSGGRLSVDDVVLDPNADRHAFVLQARAVDLQAALDAANVEAAAMSGRVSGAIPVTVSPQGIAIDHATLASDQAGVLRYTPRTPPAALQQDDDRIALLRNALDNFHYDRLSVSLSGRSGEAWHSEVQIAGNNPDLLDGQPIILNVDLSIAPAQASLNLAGTTLDVGDALPLYNALFGVGFLEWLGNRLAGHEAPYR